MAPCDLEYTSAKVGMGVPISHTNYHVNLVWLDMHRTSKCEVLLLITKSPHDLDLEDTSSKVRV